MTYLFQTQINKVPARWILLTGLAGLGLLISSAANATPFKLNTLNLGNGYSLSGKVTTDGTTGTLSRKNIKRWNITLTSRKVLKRYTTANTKMVSASGLSTDPDGEAILVTTSPDGSSNGGELTFSTKNGFSWVQLADFSGIDIDGGEAGYHYGNLSNSLSLTQPDGTSHLTAQTNSPGGNIFDIVPLDFGGGLVVSGRITTDGTTGSLTATNLINWNIIVKKITRTTFTRKNSKLLFAKEVTTDNQTLEVDRTGGRLGFGSFSSGGHRGSRNILADFTNPNFPEGRAGYIDSSIRQILKPLGDPTFETYLAGTAIPPRSNTRDAGLIREQTPAPVPEPATLFLFGDPTFETYLAGTAILPEGNTRVAGLIREETPAPVPEPATLFLFGTGLTGLAGLLARKRNPPQ